MSGPPSSKVRFAACGSVDRLRDVGGDVVDPDRLRALAAVCRSRSRAASSEPGATNVGSAPPSCRRRSSAGRSCARGPILRPPAPSPTSPGSRGRSAGWARAAPSALISTNRSTPASRAAATQRLVPSDHHRLELRRAALDDARRDGRRACSPRLRLAGSPHPRCRRLPCSAPSAAIRSPAAGLRTSARTVVTLCAAARARLVDPTKPVPPVTRICKPAGYSLVKFCQ